MDAESQVQDHQAVLAVPPEAERTQEAAMLQEASGLNPSDRTGIKVNFSEIS